MLPRAGTLQVSGRASLRLLPRPERSYGLSEMPLTPVLTPKLEDVSWLSFPRVSGFLVGQQVTS